MPGGIRRISLRAWLLGLFVVAFGVSMIDAPWGADFVLQHLLTVAFVAGLVVHGRRDPFDNASYVLIFLFMLLHVIGGHWFYSFVPYDDWFDAVVGIRLAEVFGWERNHYDRFVHFMFGVLMFHPVLVLSRRLFGLGGWRAYAIAVLIHLSISALYELLEGLVAITFSPEAAERYNGQQGDMWDAQKDSALALLGMWFSGLFEMMLDGRRARRIAGADPSHRAGGVD
jgi:putative membrane protein